MDIRDLMDLVKGMRGGLRVDAKGTVINKAGAIDEVKMTALVQASRPDVDALARLLSLGAVTGWAVVTGDFVLFPIKGTAGETFAMSGDLTVKPELALKALLAAMTPGEEKN
jgi:hypothetical protein